MFGTGLIIDYLKKRNPWWEKNYWKVDLVLNAIFFAGLIGLMFYVIGYGCDDVYEKCEEMCGHCGINVETINSGNDLDRINESIQQNTVSVENTRGFVTGG